MNELVFTQLDGLFIPGHAFIDYDEISRGVRRIHFVDNFDVLRKQFNLFGLSPHIPNREKYKSYDEYVEDSIETTINHEMMHYLLFHIGGEELSMKLHNISSWGDLVVRDHMR